MDDALLIAVAGLAIALAVALFAIQRRTDEIAVLRLDVARKNRTRAGDRGGEDAAATRDPSRR